MCDSDFDRDGVDDQYDACPENPNIFTTDLRTYQTVVLDPEGEAQVDPKWIVFDEVGVIYFAKAKGIFLLIHVRRWKVLPRKGKRIT